MRAPRYNMESKSETGCTYGEMESRCTWQMLRWQSGLAVVSVVIHSISECKQQTCIAKDVRLQICFSRAISGAFKLHEHVASKHCAL